ncbi:uncharacterized protein PHACADRAFT_262075 [Phanerochaete carnosa HHB-10118-sp]|uniref:Uncharacterized protein n=1 Tax=Phanerochaete carnosa (strain HHB-10118-sp) TaxID=650164 RepID=K5VK53_PHACS|nr:uncharacterized protein PHACADRAFT_262075 [Phanerochaete carnosa HHB-10118-sp]EKM51753.1 hypothetical protein PHACADRAFT_262075 [Phanerochaete carnosa HHB-10118-sp]
MPCIRACNSPGGDCLIDGIDHGIIEQELQECRDFFCPSYWTRPAHLTRAIEQGLRGADLVPVAMMRDAGAWMFMRPNR